MSNDGLEHAAGTLAATYGTPEFAARAQVHPRPAGVDDSTIAALGKVSEALEVVEHARGLLYGFHRLSGTADLTLQEGVRMLREAGHTELADDIGRTMIGRDIVDGRWSFQLVEAYDSGYWQVFRAVEQHAREQLGVTDPHVFEAEMKQREQRPAGG